MTDRELLELAAKAAGIRLEWDGNPEEWQPMYYQGKTYHFFDPLTDDGDALRLAVQLHLTIYQWSLSECCVCNESGTINESVSYGEDQLAATRRAIVLAAAAEIGKGMK